MAPGGTGSARTYEQTVELLREHMMAARCEYEVASQRFNQLLRIATDCARGGAHADGRLALEQASNLHHSALERYKLALQEYTDFVIHRRTPKHLYKTP